MTREELQSEVFFIVNGEIVSSSYEQYLNDYDNEDKLYIKEIMCDYWKNKITGEELSDSDHTDRQDDDEFNSDEWTFEGEGTQHYEIWMSSPSQWKNGSTDGWTFDTEEEAELEKYKRISEWISEKNWNAPCPFDTEEEAEQEIIEGISEKEYIDVSVAASIYRKSKIVKEAREIAAKLHREKSTAEYEARKTRLAIEVPAEAASLVIDDEFKQAVKEASLLSGNEKSNKCASALKGLLQRNGKDKIESDFWQVFRIIKAKIN